MEYNGVKEYVIAVNGRMWRIYGNNEKEAKTWFLRLCREYSKTTNEDHMKHWTEIHNNVLENKHTIIHNPDFFGAREILG